MRPRRLLGALAQLGHRIVYFECCGLDGPPRQPTLSPAAAAGSVTVVPVHYRLDPPTGRLRRWAAGLKITRTLRRLRIRQPVIWHYHPALFALGYSHEDAATVFDVQEDFSRWEDTLPDIFFDELMLLAESDLVIVNHVERQAHVETMQGILRQEFDQRKRASSPPHLPILLAPTPESGDPEDWLPTARTIQQVMLARTESAPSTPADEAPRHA